MTTTKPLSDEQLLHFQAWRATALQSMPYFAALLFSMRPVATAAVDTFAVDPGHRVYINFDNCIEKGATFCAQGLLHEAGHLLGEHASLAEIAGVTDEERKAWNLAGDFAINDDLRDAGCTELAAHGVFAAMIGEHDYDTPLYYMDKIRAKQQQAKKKQQGQQGQGKPQPGQGQAPGQTPGQNPGQGQGTPGPLKGCGSGAGGVLGDFELGDDSMGGDAEAASPMEKQLVKIATAAAVKDHQSSHGIGSVPGGIITMIEEGLAPSKTPWERVLAAHMRRCVARKAGYAMETFTRRNRRRMNETLRTTSGRTVGRVIAPGYIKPVPSIHFYRDVSASVGDHELGMVTTEVKAIARKLGIRGEDLMISDIDTQIHRTVRFEGAHTLNEVHGRGGTNMVKAIEHACELKNKPTVIVIASDLESGWPDERPEVPVVILGVNASQHYIEQVPEWAHLVLIGDDNV
jgi:predicted metal-dependent peptidase